jgi:death-on-curing protein
VDGNKRAGAVAAIVFLELNGIELDADEDHLEQLVFAVARKEADKPEIAEFFRSNSREVS